MIESPLRDEQSNDTMFQDAVAALQRGDKSRARELLTLLLKTDQNNPTYWIWLSAAVDNAKERIYCLQTAYKLDPENVTAKRGLVLLGALAPDETVQPFPVHRPRAWEQKLLLATEKPREKGFKAVVKSPVTRLAAVVLVMAGLASAVVFGFVLPRQIYIVPTKSITPGPSPTFTSTPTLTGATAGPTSSSFGPVEVSTLLAKNYTPTSIYVNTPRAGESGDQYRAARAAYEEGDWDAYIANMEMILQYEPNAADVYYWIGEGYRFKNDLERAKDAYDKAMELDPEFGPPYLGLALARLQDNPNASVESLFKEAIKRDPNFGEAYIERARYYLYRKDPEAALKDLDSANKVMLESPLVYMTYADAYLALGDKKNALAAAEKAYQLDATDPQTYKMLGAMCIENGQYERAIEFLNVYVAYASANDRTFALLGRAYFEMKDYQTAIDYFNKAQELNRNGLRNFYIYRGLAHLELGNLEDAVADLEEALDEDDRSFEVNVALARAYFIQEKFGSSFMRAEVLVVVADTDEEMAQALYWHAMTAEKRNQPKAAVQDWQALLALDPNKVPAELRAEAEAHLKTMITATNTAKPDTPTATRKVTVTPTKKSGTATPTAKGGTITPTPKAETATPATKAGNSPTVTVTPTAGQAVATPTFTPEP